MALRRAQATLDEDESQLMAIVAKHGRVTVRDAATLTRANRNTIKDHLGKLVDGGRLVRRGRGRGTWYEKG